MTKESYYEMCEQLGTDPESGDIPVDYDDLTNQTQLALYAFELLPDSWDSMNGTYLGKSFNILEFVLEHLVSNKSSWLTVTMLLLYIISIRVEGVNKKMKQKAKMQAKKK